MRHFDTHDRRCCYCEFHAPFPDQRMSPAAGALLGFLRAANDVAVSDRVSAVPPHTWDVILEIALEHGVAPLLHRSLQPSGALARLPVQARARIEQERRATGFGNLRKLSEFRRVSLALCQQDIPVIVLKGLHLAELVYRDVSLRPMSDMDLLVPRSQRWRALATLRLQGYSFHEQTLESGFEDERADGIEALLDRKYHVGLAHHQFGTVIEIHWSLADPLRPYTPPLDEIWHSAVPASIGDSHTLVMSPEFLLVHVSAHLAYNHTFAFSLRALCDIAEIVRAHPALDWDTVADQGRRHGWRIGVAAALRLARDHLGADVPAHALAAIGGDVLAPERLDEALQHLLAFAEIPDDLSAAPNLMLLAGQTGLGAKLATVWKRLFVPRAELALIYSVPPRSARLYFCYAVRLRDLVRTYAASAWAFSVSDPQVAAMAARHARLARWVNGG
jgi:hypothetical protein